MNYLYVMFYASERRSGRVDNHFMSFTNILDAQAIADTCHEERKDVKIAMQIYNIKRQKVTFTKSEDGTIKDSWNNGYIDTMVFYSDTGRKWHHMEFNSFDYGLECAKTKLLEKKKTK